MKIDDLFIRDKENSTSKVMKIFSELDKKVRDKYYDEKRPIMKGTIHKYNDLMKDKDLDNNPKPVDKVIEDFSTMFERAVLWENPGAMINITPPANVLSIASSFYTSLYNPNFAQDESCGYLTTTELLVSKYLSTLAGWNPKKAGGIFTFGGKGTNLYAIKIGMQKAIPNIIDEGIKGKDIIVISNEKSHPCHREVCDWLGLGKNSCIRLKTDKNGQVDLNEMEQVLRDALGKGKVIGGIIINGGTTNEIIVDPIKKVVDLRDKLVKEYKLNYKPHVHVDAVIGWAWLFFKDYDFDKNELKMSDKVLSKIKSQMNKIKQVKYADSFGADFHKTGFCPYISSIFMANNFQDITNLGKKNSKPIDELQFGEYSPFEYTLELTRSSIGPVSAYITLETLGKKGFQELLYRLFDNTEYIRDYLDSQNDFEVINKDTEGIATLYVIKQTNDKKKYIDYVNSDSSIKEKFLNYNHQFYLYCLKKLEENKIHFKITFSKSYKPYGSDIPTGALKIYPTSPIVSKKELKEILDEMIEIKHDYDHDNSKLVEERDTPIDFVYR